MVDYEKPWPWNVYDKIDREKEALGKAAKHLDETVENLERDIDTELKAKELTVKEVKSGIVNRFKSWFKSEKTVEEELVEVKEPTKATSFEVPRNAKKIVVTVTKSNGSVSTYVVSNYINLDAGDIIRIEA